MDWLLLRGLTREQSHWGDFPRRLAERFPGHRFHCADLPGTGVRLNEQSPVTIAGIREQVRQSVELPEPFGLIGLSMGGMVALDWAQNHPQGVAGLVLINTSTGFSPPWRRMRTAALVSAPGLVFSPADRRESAILGLTSRQGATDPETLRAWVRIQQQRPVRRAAMLAQLLAAAAYRPHSGAPPVPGMLLASQGDRIVHWRCSHTLSRRWDWPLWLHPEAGHDLPLDDPDWLLERLADLLA